MAVALPAFPTPSSSFFASIDMGSNSFKLLIVSADPSGKFFPVDHKKEPVVLGRDTAATTATYSISVQSTQRALEALAKFKKLLDDHSVSRSQIRCVATAAVREADNRKEIVDCVMDNIGIEVDVLSGEDEARLAYLGVLQFLPIHDILTLTVDIGGGSTEFVIGKEGKVVFGTSLKLGHVYLTQRFPDTDSIPQMREHIRSVINESGLVERIKEHRFEIAVGSSGTIRAIDKAVFHGYSCDGSVNKAVLAGDSKRAWSFTRGELSGVVGTLCDGGGGGKERERRDGFFKRRSEFIVAGAVLLDEIFDMLGVEEMQVSRYSLGEGVIAESLAKAYPSCYDLNANARWQSVMRLAMSFNDKKRMRSSSQCAGLAKEILEDLRKCKDLASDEDKLPTFLNKELEYLEAACLLHNIGLVNGKRGYHKQSYQIFMNGGHLCGYNDEEVKLIALLTRHQRKKFPKSDSYMEISKEQHDSLESLVLDLLYSSADFYWKS